MSLTAEQRICFYLDKLKGRSSTNDKVEMLKEYLQDDAFNTMVVLALTSTLSYNVKNVTWDDSSGPLFNETHSIQDIFKYLYKMAERNGATNEEKNQLSGMISNQFQHRIVSMIIKKKLDCGVSAKLINKAVPGTVFVMPYMRCSTTDKISRIKYPAIVDIKADGMFLNIISKNGIVDLKTRPGLPLPLNNRELIDEVKRITQGSECVMMGEARVKGDDGKYLPRKISNGLLNSMLQGSAPPEVHAKTVITLWDIIPYEDFMEGECDIPYEDRLQDLLDAGVKRSMQPPKFSFIHLIHAEEVQSKEQAFEIAAKWIAEGEEGGILKNLKSVWKNHTCPEWIKLKSEKECELRITGWEYAEAGSKFDGLMGSVKCESECGKLKVNVSGWNDEERKWDWDEHIGKIITVKFNEVIESKSKDTLSLFLPRVSKIDRTEFVEFRLDKTEADSMEQILKK